MLPKLDICAAAIAALTITLVDVAAAQDKISGKVVDTGLDSASGGIAGVRIVVTDLMSQKTVGEGVTTANGDYSIEIGNAKVPLIASFAKIGYFARPTRQLVTSVSQSQPTTRLSRASASDGYYKAVAENIWKAKGDDPDGLNSFLSAVSSLPGKEKSTVLTELRVKNTSAYRQFLTADETYQSAQEIGTALMKSEKAGYKMIFAHPDANTGSVSLYGAVPTLSDKKSAEEFAKLVGGNKAVTNVLTVR